MDNSGNMAHMSRYRHTGYSEAFHRPSRAVSGFDSYSKGRLLRGITLGKQRPSLQIGKRPKSLRLGPVVEVLA